MLRESKSGGLESLQIVACLATIGIRRLSKLPSMLIRVTVSATLKLDFIARGLALRDMAFRARHRSMLPLQRVGGCRVLLYPESRRFKTLHGVAIPAFPAVRPLRKLPAMGIGFMAIHASLKNQRLLKVPLSMTLHTLHICMLPQQRKFRLRMIEALTQHRSRNSIPPNRAVAGLTSLLEAAAMGIGVAIFAVPEGDSGVSWPSVMPGRVALATKHLSVQPG